MSHFHWMCQDCLTKGRAQAAAELHHIVPIDLDRSKRLEFDNLLPLCESCHADRHGGRAFFAAAQATSDHCPPPQA